MSEKKKISSLEKPIKSKTKHTKEKCAAGTENCTGFAANDGTSLCEACNEYYGTKE
jgi:hypothetical protein